MCLDAGWREGGEHETETGVVFLLETLKLGYRGVWLLLGPCLLEEQGDFPHCFDLFL